MLEGILQAPFSNFLIEIERYRAWDLHSLGGLVLRDILTSHRSKMILENRLKRLLIIRN